MDRDELEKLLRTVEESNAAVRAHWASLNVDVWYGGGQGSNGPRGNRSWDDSWRAEYAALRAARDEAEDRLNAAFLRDTHNDGPGRLTIDQATAGSRPSADLYRAVEPPKPNRKERRQS